MSNIPDNSSSAAAVTPPQMNRMEPVLNVGKQCAVYLGVVAALAGGVAFFGPFDHMPAVAQEQTTLPLKGEFDMMVPLGEEDTVPKSVAFFYITGAPAQKMWEAFPMEPIEDECVGRLSKFGNGMICYGANGDGTTPDEPYECTFGIDMKSQALTLAQDC